MYSWSYVSPWPTINSKGELFNGSTFEKLPDCVDCKNKECRPNEHIVEDSKYDRCRKGISFYNIKLSEEEQISINGLLLDIHLPTTQKKNLRKLRSRTVALADVEKWINSNAQPLLASLLDVNQNIVDYIIHNLQWPLNAAIRYSESLYLGAKEGSEKDKIEKLPQNQRQLVKAIELIEKSLELAPISVNPESGRSGEKRLKPIYRLLDRLSWVFKDVALANNKIIGAPIGPSWGRCLVYDSFELIPLLLIENAIKYANYNSEINIKLIDNIQLKIVTLSIESIGEEIISPVRETMFRRGIRGTTGAGRGLGLFFAQRIAKINNTEIFYRFDQPSTNVFYLNVPAFDFQDKK